MVTPFSIHNYDSSKYDDVGEVLNNNCLDKAQCTLVLMSQQALMLVFHPRKFQTYLESPQVAHAYDLFCTKQAGIQTHN